MKTLIVYTTKHGSVAAVAQMIQDKIPETTVVNCMTDIVPPLDCYSTIILGASIYMGKIQPEMKHFIETHLDVLMKKKIGIFLCSGREEPNIFPDNFPARLLEHASITSVVGYAYYTEKLSFIEKLAVKAIAGIKATEEKFNLKKIDDFAAKITE